MERTDVLKTCNVSIQKEELVSLRDHLACGKPQLFEQFAGLIETKRRDFRSLTIIINESTCSQNATLEGFQSYCSFSSFKPFAKIIGIRLKSFVKKSKSSMKAKSNECWDVHWLDEFAWNRYPKHYWRSKDNVLLWHELCVIEPKLLIYWRATQ